MLGDVVIERATAADDAARSNLHALCFGFRPPDETFAWKYRENPHGEAIDLVARVDGEVVATFALVPRRWWVGEHGSVMAYQASDAMTRPEWRSRGLFTALLERAHVEARAQDGAFCFAFAGWRSLGAFERTGYRACFQTYVARKRCRRFPRLFRRDETALLGAPPVARSLERHNAFCGVRDEAFLAWKTRAAGISMYVSRALDGREALLEHVGAAVVVSDDLGRERFDREFLAGMVRSLGRATTREISVTLVVGEALESTFLSLGFRRNSALLPFSVRPLCMPWNVVRELTRDPRNVWIRDVDRDAQGLLLRAACEERRR